MNFKFDKVGQNSTKFITTNLISAEEISDGFENLSFSKIGEGKTTFNSIINFDEDDETKVPRKPKTEYEKLVKMSTTATNESLLKYIDNLENQQNKSLNDNFLLKNFSFSTKELIAFQKKYKTELFENSIK